jgi:hypothetical protein
MNLQRGIFRILVVASAFWIIDLTALTYSEKQSVAKSLPPSPDGYLLDPRFSDPFFWALKEFGAAFVVVLLVIMGWIFAGFRSTK